MTGRPPNRNVRFAFHPNASDFHPNASDFHPNASDSIQMPQTDITPSRYRTDTHDIPIESSRNDLPPRTTHNSATCLLAETPSGAFKPAILWLTFLPPKPTRNQHALIVPRN